ncbi:MAG: hypothetical protein AAB351_03435 [Patescibacteria group bacterium]
MNIFIKISSVFLLLLVFFVAVPVFAAEIRLDVHKSEISCGEEFLMDIVIHTDESLNAIEGQLIFPTDKLLVKEIRDGNSIINFWVEKPRIEASGFILFSGITPGGFSGASNNIFSVVFEAKNIGVASVALQNVKALKNNGLGTEAMLSTRNTLVSIKPGDGNMHKEILIDKELPEDFNPSIESDPNVFGGKYFLVFATQDKTSGIDRYEVREGERDRFRVAETPYLLKYQALDRKIFVKAIDKVGNERIVVLNAQHQAPWYRQYAVLGILLVIVLVWFLIKKSWSRFIK